MKWSAIYTDYGTNYFDVEVEVVYFHNLTGLENFIRIVDAYGYKVLINKKNITHIEI